MDIWTAIIGGLPALIIAILVFIQNLTTQKQLHEVHLLINSRLSELLVSVRKEGYSAGQSEGKSDGASSPYPNR